MGPRGSGVAPQTGVSVRSVIVLGSSPLVRQAYATARVDWPDALTVTCNRGLEIEPQPDFYFLSDCIACQMWSRNGKEAAKRGKTKTVTLRRDPQAMKMRTVDDFDIVVREGHPFEPFQLSGLWCFEFAIRVLAAQQLVLCGMDGYRPAVGLTDYFDGAVQLPGAAGLGKNTLERVIQPLTDRLAAKYPAVFITIVGEPCYNVPKGWTVRSSVR